MGATWTSRVDRGPSMTADQVKAALGDSPLSFYAQRIYDDGVRYNVDPALFLAIAKYESDFGRAASSIYDRSTGLGSYNWTSISNALYGGSPVAGSRWGQYPDPQTGIDAFFKLITSEYYPNGQNTVGSIMWGVGGSSTVSGSHAYAPASENPVAYFNNFIGYLSGISGGVSIAGDPLKPPANVVGKQNPSWLPDPFTGLPGPTLPNIQLPSPPSVPSIPDIPGAIKALSGTLASLPNLATAPFVDFLNQVKAVGDFIGQPNFLRRVLFLVGGFLVAIVGLILFAASFVHLPGGAKVG